MGVEAGRRQHPRGLEALGQGDDDLVDQGAVGVAGGAGGHGHVHVGAPARAVAALVHETGARVERVLVGRDVGDPGVAPEHGLGAVAVVDVPVHDQDPLAPTGENGRGHGDVVQEAEAHGLAGQGVVARRAHGEEGGLPLAPVEALDGVGPRPRGLHGDLPRRRSRPGIGVDGAPSPGAEGGQGVEVLAGVHQLQLGPGGGPGREGEHGFVDAGRCDPPQHCGQPRRALRVTRAGLVVEEAAVAAQQHRHGASRYSYGPPPVARRAAPPPLR